MIYQLKPIRMATMKRKEKKRREKEREKKRKKKCSLQYREIGKLVRYQ